MMDQIKMFINLDSMIGTVSLYVSINNGDIIYNLYTNLNLVYFLLAK